MSQGDISHQAISILLFVWEDWHGCRAAEDMQTLLFKMEIK